MTAKTDPLDVLTPDARLSFSSLFVAKPRSQPTPENPTPKTTFQATFLLPPGTDLKPFEAAIVAAMVKKFGKKIVLTPRNNPLKDAAEKEYAGYEAGWRYIACHSDRQVPIVDQKRVPVTDPDRVYNGMWVRGYLNCFAWAHPTGGKGVSFGLNAVQLVGDGERFGRGPVDTDKVFEALEMPEEDLTGGLG